MSFNKSYTASNNHILTVVGILICLAMGFIIGFVVRGSRDMDSTIDRAICIFGGEDDPYIGYIRFAKRFDGRVSIHGNVSGMDGHHGLHIHEYGNLGDNCRATGGHFNPFLRSHGGPYSEERHVGDLGNVNFVNNTAIIAMEAADDLLDGMTSVIGRSIVIHQGWDDLGLGNHPSSSINGRAGPKLACCVIAVERP